MAAFAAVLCCTIGLGAFALTRLQAVDDAAEVIRLDYLPSSRVLATITYTTMRVRTIEVTQTMTHDDKGRAEEAATLQETLRAAEDAITAHAPLVDPDGEDQRLYAEMRRSWASYLTLHDRLVTLQQKPDQTGANALFLGEMRTLFRGFQATQQRDIALNVREGNAASAHATALGRAGHSWILAALALTAALCMAVGIGLVRALSNPIVAMTGAMQRLANQDMATVIPCTGRGDEVGGMAAAVQVFKDNMAAALRLSAAQMAEQRAKELRAARMATIVQAFEVHIGQMAGQLGTASTELEATARSMSATASDTDERAAAVTAAATETGMGVQTVAAASEQLAASISEISRQVMHSAQKSGQAVADARRTGGTVRTLADAAQRIGQVVELISGIASQTNLLALNATIEAARAGEYGRGFAVVAGEVKSLATQTAGATGEIAGQITQIQAATREAVKAIREIAQSVEEVGGIATSIAAAVEQQGAATAEIARNVQQTAASTRLVNSNIAGVSQAAGSTGVAAGLVLHAAADLARQAEQLTSDVNGFLGDMRAA